MKIIKGNIFDGKWSGLVHCANLYTTFGSGIARQIKQRFPLAYEADCQTKNGDRSKLGGFSHAMLPLGDDMIDIFNLYGQEGIGCDGNPLERNVRYDKIHDGLFQICNRILDIKDENTYILAMPEMGCGLAGGDRGIIHAIMNFVESKFEEIEFNLYVL